jgi:ABC-type lipoprotein release transport system permease subunit
MGAFERQRNILDFTLSSILRRKARSAALLLLYALVVAVLASVLFFTGAVRREAALLLKDSPEMVLQRTVMGRHSLLPSSYIETASRIRGVQGARGRLWGYYYDPVAGANYTFMAKEDFAHGPGSAVLGRGVARARLAEKGDLLPLRAHDGGQRAFRVADVLSPGSELLASDMILVSVEDFRELFGIAGGLFTDAALSVRNERELPTIARKITEALPDSRPVIRSEVLRTYQSVFNWRGGMIAVVLSAAVLAFVIFAADRASGLSAEERREIGVLKAVGWETGDVLWMKFWEGACVSLVGYLLGVTLGYAHVFVFDSAVFEPALKGWSVLYPEFRLTPVIEFSDLGVLFALTVLPYTAATVVPSWKASVAEPDMVMRE